MYCMCYCFSFKFRLFLLSLLYCSFVPPIYFLLFLLSIIRCSSYLCSIFLRSMFIFSSCLCAIVPLPNSFVPPIFVLLFLCPSYVSPIFLCTYVHMFYCSFCPLTNVPPFYVLLFLLSISRCSSYLGSIILLSMFCCPSFLRSCVPLFLFWYSSVYVLFFTCFTFSLPASNSIFLLQLVTGSGWECCLRTVQYTALCVLLVYAQWQQILTNFMATARTHLPIKHFNWMLRKEDCFYKNMFI